MCLALFCACTTAFAQKRGEPDIDVEQLRKLQFAQLAISNLYVDSVDQKKLVEDAINGMLSKLDPHSSYTNAEETRKLNEPLEGNFEGIGVQFNMLNDTLVVIQPTAKGPSERAGIVAGDRIVSVDGRAIAGVKMDRDSIMRLLRGPKNSKVVLGVVRRGVKAPLSFKVTRDKIPVNTVDAAYIIAPRIGYIHLERFGATSGKEVHDAIAKLQGEGMEKLIFDLGVNGGGYLGAAVDVASEFLPGGSLVVYTQGRTGKDSQLRASSNGLFRKGGLAILVDEYTASAAEIVSGAVQDHDRGVIVGRRTFGKGLVQRPVELPDGSMIRLTVSHYYTPSGRCIQKPYVKGEKEKYNEDLNTRFTHGELMHLDSIHLDSTKVYTTLENTAPSTAAVASCPISSCHSTPRVTRPTTAPSRATTSLRRPPCVSPIATASPSCAAISRSTTTSLPTPSPPLSSTTSRKRPRRRASNRKMRPSVRRHVKTWPLCLKPSWPTTYGTATSISASSIRRTTS